MTYSVYQNDRELHAAAVRYAEMYGGTFCRTDPDGFLFYRDCSGEAFLPVDGTDDVPFLTKRLCQATQRQYTVDLLTLWWMPVSEEELLDVPGFLRSLSPAAMRGESSRLSE